jgi:uncharacterized protein YxjI
MKYYAKCNNVFNISDVIIYDENDIQRYKIKHRILKTISGLKIYDQDNKFLYNVNYNPLKLKNHFILRNKEKDPIIKISLGLKQLHKLEYKKKKYMVKASFLKINYRLYDLDKEIALIRVKKHNNQRRYEIVLKEKVDEIFAMCLLIIAQTMRDRVWFIYGIKKN